MREPRHDDVTAIARAIKKAWVRCAGSMPLSVPVAIYLLGVGTQPGGPRLAYDFGEFAAFLGGVADGEFDDLATAKLSSEAGRVAGDAEIIERALDWDRVSVPGIDLQRLGLVFAAVEPRLPWVSAGDGGPAWCRVFFHLSRGTSRDTYTVDDASVSPELTISEIQAIAALPHPPPSEIGRRGYLIPVGHD